MPAPLAAVASLLPSGALAEGLRAALSTGHAPTAGQVLVLVAWALVGGRRRRPPRPLALTTAPVRVRSRPGVRSAGWGRRA